MLQLTQLIRVEVTDSKHSTSLFEEFNIMCDFSFFFISHVCPFGVYVFDRRVVPPFKSTPVQK